MPPTTPESLRAAIHAATAHYRAAPGMVRGLRVPYHRRGELVVPAFRMRPGGNPETDGRTESLRVMQRAPSLGADMVFFDCEDASPDHPEFKSLARRYAVEALLTTDLRGLVMGFRPNGIRTPYFADDLTDVVTRAGHLLQVLVIPKTEHPDEVKDILRFVEDLRRLAGHTTPISLEILIESPAAFLRSEEIASLDGVTALAFGAWDFARSIGGTVDAEHWIQDQRMIRQMLAVIAASHGKEAVDAVTATIPVRPSPPPGMTPEAYAEALAAADPGGLTADHSFIEALAARRRAVDLARRDAADARACGLAAKWILHPDQIAPIQDAWTPSAERAREALRMAVRYTAASGDGSGAETSGTLMVDRAVVGAEWWVVHAALRAGVLRDADITATGYTLTRLEQAVLSHSR